MENLDPPSPQIKDGKVARFCPSRGFILDLGGMGFAVSFYFVQDCSLLCLSRNVCVTRQNGCEGD